MRSKEETAGGSDYTVDVNAEVAFTINYDDDRGRLLFSIEVGDDPKRVFLNPMPSENGHMVDAHDEAAKARVSIAVERVKAYFNSKGLTVELD